MKAYKTPAMELCLIAKEDVLSASIIENIGTVIDFSEGREEAPEPMYD